MLILGSGRGGPSWLQKAEATWPWNLVVRVIYKGGLVPEAARGAASTFHWMNSLPRIFLSRIPVGWQFGAFQWESRRILFCLHARSSLVGVQQVYPLLEMVWEIQGAEEENVQRCSSWYRRHLQVTGSLCCLVHQVVSVGHGVRDWLAVRVDSWAVSGNGRRRGHSVIVAVLAQHKCTKQ